MTQETRKRSRRYGTLLVLFATLAFALGACSGSGTQNGGSFGTGDEGSGSLPMESSGTDSSGGTGSY
jgi:hypothetical protein